MLDEVIRFLQQYAENKEDVKPSSIYREMGDSYTMIFITMELEETFNVFIHDSVLQEITTVESLAKYLDKSLKSNETLDTFWDN